MLKYLILAAILYIGYRLFFRKPLLRGPNQSDSGEQFQDLDDEFVEYEEID